MLVEIESYDRHRTIRLIAKEFEKRYGMAGGETFLCGELMGRADVDL